jgi:hypothetical protein
MRIKCRDSNRTRHDLVLDKHVVHRYNMGGRRNLVAETTQDELEKRGRGMLHRAGRGEIKCH